MNNRNNGPKVSYQGVCRDCEKTVGGKLYQKNQEGVYFRCGGCEEIVYCSPLSKQTQSNV